MTASQREEQIGLISALFKVCEAADGIDLQTKASCLRYVSEELQREAYEKQQPSRMTVRDVL